MCVAGVCPVGVRKSAALRRRLTLPLPTPHSHPYNFPPQTHLTPIIHTSLFKSENNKVSDPHPHHFLLVNSRVIVTNRHYAKCQLPIGNKGNAIKRKVSNRSKPEKNSLTLSFTIKNYSKNEKELEHHTSYTVYTAIQHSSRVLRFLMPMDSCNLQFN